jgi:hypothetical protein
MRADPDEDVGVVALGVDAGLATGLGEGQDDGGGAAAAHAAGEQPVVPVMETSP